MGPMEYASLPPGQLTTKQAAMACGVKPDTIRDWVRRGILERCGGSPRRPIFRVEDVMAAKVAPKPRAQRTAATACPPVPPKAPPRAGPSP